MEIGFIQFNDSSMQNFENVAFLAFNSNNLAKKPNDHGLDVPVQIIILLKLCSQLDLQKRQKFGHCPYEQTIMEWDN